MSGTMNLEGKVIENLGAGSNPNDAVTYAQLATKLSLAGGVMTGALQMGGKKIENVAASTSLTDAVTRAELNNKFNVTGGAMTGYLDMGSNNITNVNLINNISLSSMKTSLDSIETKAFHLGYTAPNNNPLLTMNGDVKAKSFVKNGALASEFLMGDGSTMAGSDASLKSNFYRFTVSTDNTTDPEPGQIMFNNATHGSATEIRINRMTSDNLNIRFIFDMLSSLNEIYIRAAGSATDYIKYGVSGAPSVSTSYVVIPVVMRTAGGVGDSNFASGAGVLIAFFADLKAANTRLTTLEAGGVSGGGGGVSGDYLLLTGGALSGVLNMGGYKITSTYEPVNGPDLVNKTYVDGAIASIGGGGGVSGDYLPLSGGALNGDLDMGLYKIRAAYIPTADAELVNKGYVDTAIMNSGGGGGGVSGDYLPMSGGTLTGGLAASSFTVPFASGFLMANGYVNENSYVNTSGDSYVTGEITAHKFKKLDGTAYQYLMADGSALQYSANSGNSNFYFYKSSTLIGMPSAGCVTYNNASQNDANRVYISYKTRDDINIEVFYKSLSSLNIVYIQSQNSSADYIKYDITGAPTITDGVRIEIPVAKLESAGLGASSFANDSDVILSFFTNSVEADTRISNLENTYLKKDGTVAMTGALNMGAQNITNAGSISATSISLGGASTSFLMANGTSNNLRYGYRKFIKMDATILNATNGSILGSILPSTGHQFVANELVVGDMYELKIDGGVNYTVGNNSSFTFTFAGVSIPVTLKYTVANIGSYPAFSLRATYVIRTLSKTTGSFYFYQSYSVSRDNDNNNISTPLMYGYAIGPTAANTIDAFNFGVSWTGPAGNMIAVNAMVLSKI